MQTPGITLQPVRLRKPAGRATAEGNDAPAHDAWRKGKQSVAGAAEDVLGLHLKSKCGKQEKFKSEQP